jgi:hypothetical protein
MKSPDQTQRKVIIQVTFEYEIAVPMEWSPDEIEDYRNHSRFCQNDALDELIRLSDKKGCICGYATTKYIRESIDTLEIESIHDR